jgi:hypothetical protein
MMAHEIGTMDWGIGSMHQGIGPMDRGFGSMDRGFGSMDKGFGTMDWGFETMDQGFGTMDRGIVMILPALQQSRRGFFPQCIASSRTSDRAAGELKERLGKKSTRNGV